MEHFIDHCRTNLYDDNAGKSENAEKFQRKCRKQGSIQWYTHHRFLFHLLNRALRKMDGDIIVRMGFFINDLHLALEQLCRQQHKSQSCARILIVYCSQHLSNDMM
ncbi:unnamed protein product, partial [Adineta ricciae]